MSLPRFFLENQVLAAETEAVFPLRLEADDAKHARVLRLAAGEHIAVIDADQDYFECEIVDFADELPLVSIARHEDASEAGPQVILLQGLAKGDKMETVIRHATEPSIRKRARMWHDRYMKWRPPTRHERPLSATSTSRSKTRT